MDMDPMDLEYNPTVWFNDFWLLRDKLVALNDTVEEVPIHMSLGMMGLWKWNLYLQMEKSFALQVHPPPRGGGQAFYSSYHPDTPACYSSCHPDTPISAHPSLCKAGCWSHSSCCAFCPLPKMVAAQGCRESKPGLSCSWTGVHGLPCVCLSMQLGGT
jgi:Cleft lip and palate transmembrane protein 1 (CLPTM1)